MKSLSIRCLLALFLLPLVTFAKVQNGAVAPDFSMTTPNGESVSLSNFAGRYVVLEWTNPGCPFVKKFYRVGAMQRFQKAAQEQGAVWLTINSTRAGHGQYLDVPETIAYLDDKGVNSIWLLDEDGAVGKAYGASNTPHMFILDPSGTVVYQGAIDDKRSASSKDIDGAHNYVLAALDSALSGQPIDRAETRPYGCGIKY